MKRDGRAIVSITGRCLRLRCPACGASSIVEGAFRIKHQCPVCDSLFKREDGFFVGAIMTNVVATEFVILVLYVLSLWVWRVDFNRVLVALSVIALAFPVAFYHHSWSIWLAFDHLVETLPRANNSRER